MSEKQTLGLALRAMSGGNVEVMMRAQDWSQKNIPGAGVALGQELVAFKAIGFAEVAPGSDVWRFDLIEEDDKGDRRALHLYVCGGDLIMVRREKNAAA